jgi:hypothetical protein
VSQAETEWKVYRTRFLIRAKQLTEPLVFTDPLGHEQCGNPGDYLVESSDGMRRIARREIFEDIYVPICSPEDNLSPPPKRDLPLASAAAAPAARRALVV